jgi:3-methyladenine DNA glycosylase AlkD
MVSQKRRESGNEGGQIADRIISELSRTAGSTPAIRGLRKKISKQLVEADRKTILSVAQELIDRAPFGRFVGYELVHYHDGTMRALTEKEVQSLGQGISSWGDVDTFACYISGPAWKAGRIADETIERWAHSKDRWWRRAALVSTVPLNSGKMPAPDGVHRTLAVCSLLTLDRDDMVVKAMSWALRALATRDPESAREFLQGRKKELPARVIREVQNKLQTGLKNPRKGKAEGIASGPAASRSYYGLTIQ